MDLPKNEYLSYCIIDYLATYYRYEFQSACEGWNAIEWLSISSNLESVRISPSRFDDGLFYCHTARDYTKSKCELQSDLTTELVRFHFAWGALESLIKVFVPAKRVEKYGTINALCGYLRNCGLEQHLPVGYIDEYEHLVSLLRTAGGYQKELTKLNLNTKISYNFKDYVDISGIGIFVVYRVRNQFAHGTMRFPEPEEYSGEYICETELIEVATRIVLMEILVLLISDIKGKDFFLEDEDFFLEDIEEDAKHSALEYLKNLCTLPSGTL